MLLELAGSNRFGGFADRTSCSNWFVWICLKPDSFVQTGLKSIGLTGSIPAMKKFGKKLSFLFYSCT
jgi:hypothetical protein